MQIKNSRPKRIADVSKRLPEAAQNYSITELELCSLVINIVSFAHILKNVDFDALIDHLALTNSIKGKAEPATYKIGKIVRGVMFLFIHSLLYKR